MMFVADDLAAWLVGVLADAGRNRLIVWVRGTDQERAFPGTPQITVPARSFSISAEE
jgi:hypothetical protein